MSTKSSHSVQALPCCFIALLVPTLMVGCAGQGKAGIERGKKLATTDFRAGPEASGVKLETDKQLVVQSPDPAPIRQTLSIGPSLAAAPLVASGSPSTQAYLTTPGAPVASSSAAPAASPTLIDAKVGDINGRPIYASAFFEPMAQAFLAEAERMPRAAWLGFVRNTITQTLDGIITDELLRAEALSRLSPEQQQGLRSFLQKTRERMIGNNLGSEKLAEEKARAERGRSLNDLVREERESILISLEIRESINRRVNVSWRDVKQRYLRDFDQWNPDPVAVFRVIRVRDTDTQAIETISKRLAAGDDFEAVASEPFNAFNPAEHGLQSTSFETEFAEGLFFGPDPLNEAARALEPGEHAGPISFGSLVFWVRLESVDISSTSLYDAQLAIETQLLSERRRAELDRYIGRLVDRARVGNREKIIESLYQIAVERYGPEG